MMATPLFLEYVGLATRSLRVLLKQKPQTLTLTLILNTLLQPPGSIPVVLIFEILVIKFTFLLD